MVSLEEFNLFKADVQRRLSALESNESRKRKKLDSPVEDTDQISLNIGGKVFSTTCTTLAQAGENTFLRYIVRGGEETVPFKKDSKGHICIDRNHKHFMKILDFLRSGPESFAKPKSDHECDEILAEANFYGLRALAWCVDRLRMPWFTVDVASRNAPTAATMMRTGLFASWLTAPNPENYDVVIKLEGTKLERVKAHGPNRHHIKEPDPWCIALTLPPKEPLMIAPTIEVIGQWPQRSWTPRDDYDFKVGTPVQWNQWHPEFKPSIIVPGWRLINFPHQYYSLGPRRREVGVAGDINSVESVEHWKLDLLKERPAGVILPECCARNICHLDELYNKRRHPDDRLEVWSESPYYKMTVRDYGQSSLLVMCGKAERLTAAAGRIGYAGGGSEVFWVSWEDDHSTSAAVAVVHNGSLVGDLKNKPFFEFTKGISFGRRDNKISIGNSIFTVPEDVGDNIRCEFSCEDKTCVSYSLQR